MFLGERDILPPVSKASNEAKSKADGLGKSVICIQVCWMMIQISVVIIFLVSIKSVCHAQTLREAKIHLYFVVNDTLYSSHGKDYVNHNFIAADWKCKHRIVSGITGSLINLNGLTGRIHPIRQLQHIQSQHPRF